MKIPVTSSPLGCSSEKPSTLLELRKFVAPEFIFGNGARNLAGRYARKFGGNNIFVVTDPGILAAGWVDQVLQSLDQEGINYTVFSDVHSNPRSEEVMDGAELYIRNKCNLILAIGGGSPMDCAKGIAAVSSNQINVLKFEGVDEIPVPGPPLLCIPSTAGSSADVSQFAIINDTNRKVKIAIISKAVVPDLALIDPEVTHTMDPYLTACTGMDTLTHAIEAYVSNANSPITDTHALRAICLTSNNLLTAVENPKDDLARHNMMLASLHAGLAFSNASLGAVHAMAHSLGGLLDLPHGECNALLLEHVIHFNYDAAADRYNQITQILGLPGDEISTGGEKDYLLGRIQSLRKSIGIGKTLSQVGVKQSDLDPLAQNAQNDPCIITNPVNLDLPDIRRIYERAF